MLAAPTCMPLVADVTPRDLCEFLHNPQARTHDFFAAIAADLPPGPAEVALLVGERLVTKHCCVRICALFKLMRYQVVTIITDCGGYAGWIESIEEFAGFKFADQTVPESSALVSQSTKRSGCSADRPEKIKVLRTISEKLVNQGTLVDEKLPSTCFLGIKTPNYETNTIKDQELHHVLNNVAAYVVARHKSLKIGKNLAEIYARQIKDELPRLPPRGKLPGHERDVAQMILDKVKNRTYVRLP